MTSTQAGHVVGGRYRLVAELGSGGFGRVWQARDQTLDVEVAIKELRLLPGMSPAEQAERLARATREARNAARLRNHENIVAIHDVVVENGLPWIVMELIDGCSLNEHIKAHGPLRADEAAKVAEALLAAIDAAHRKGVVHRDIKPANVMLDESGKVLLTDFGTAVHTTDTTLTATGMFIGSPEYMAPERLNGTDGLPASDLFSLGATLYEAVEGVSPFRRNDQTATLAAVLLETPPSPQRAGRLTRLITRLLDKDPDKRPTVAEALTTTGEQPTSPVRVQRDTRVLPPRGTPKVWQRKGVAVMMAIIAALGVVGLTNSGVAWDYFERDVERAGPDGVAVLVALVVDIVLAGVLCAGVARFVPPRAGQTVAVVAGLAGLLFGAGAAASAFDGGAEILRNWMALADRRSAPQISLIVVTIVVLIAAGWAWEARRARRRTPDPVEARR
ncbi:serine/threonine-protein kinase [Allokutzneria oryzae]|uniref:non-specific serine/threonine protein kinase n=1 Tax=Allokutzneria oryzae TaxID=1378989 RepID=A0ABV6A739_9PSEU